MAMVLVTRSCALPPAEAWRRLTRWERHAAHVPLTAVRVEGGAGEGVGTRFTARTGVGPAGFDDPMEVVVWQPPRDGGGGRCRLVKRGRVVTGWAEIAVWPRGAGCVVVWRERVAVAGVPQAFGPLVAAAGRWAFGRTVDGLLAGS